MSNTQDEKLIVAFTGNPMDAEIIKQLLENHNIKANIINPYTSRIAPHIVPEATVMIMQKDIKEATELLKHFNLSN